MEPMYKRETKVEFSSLSKEKAISKINATKIWRKSNDKNALIQALKNQLHLSIIRVIMAKGEIKQNTSIIIYRREYDKTKLIKPIDINALISPSKEKRLKFPEVTGNKVFIWLIKFVKQISVPRTSSPKLLIAREKK